MTIGEFIYNKDYSVYGRIVVIGHTKNDKCCETHKVYDSCHPKFQGHAIPEDIQKLVINSIGPAEDGIALHYVTTELISHYL